MDRKTRSFSGVALIVSVGMGISLVDCSSSGAPNPTPDPPSVSGPDSEPDFSALSLPQPHFAGPTLERWKPAFKEDPWAPPAARFTHVAVVTGLDVPLYGSTDGRTVVGYTGIGRLLPARPTGNGCDGGAWYEVTGNAYLCDGDGIRIEKRPYRKDMLDDSIRLRAPDLERPVPYRHGKAHENAPLLARLPAQVEGADPDQARDPDGLVDQTLNGIYLLTLIRRVADGSERYFQVLRGDYIREKDIKVFREPQMHGERLGGGVSLPLAFTHTEATVYCVGGAFETPCGRADKHARFPAGRLTESGGGMRVMAGDGFAVRREDIRIARKIPRPAGVEADDQWVHIDLSEQTLVAYDGDRPVYATLVSSGKPEKATPDGLFTVNRTYVTKVMNGMDEDGPYQVQEVPWVMYFKGNYALHGAYWHSVFGNTRSHGCVNLPPVDARWLFYWARPRLPRGWTAQLNVDGPRVYVTGRTPPDPGEESGA
jgi:hypothetical protein